ncbi:MAG: D-aminoacyl-tRNA deacylase [Clostridia bacterium]|nr:D-aminoacyl-tRNA deacylase [Clostridia bacterium]
MRALLQRVTEASVTIDGVKIAEIGKGFLILLGVKRGDDEEDARLLADKIAKFRVFSDENGKMNKSIADIGGEFLVVSQFTLYANYAHGNRPDFLTSEEPVRANALYEHFSALLRERGIPVKNGVFGADMKVALINDGPVTVMMESETLRK